MSALPFPFHPPSVPPPFPVGASALCLLWVAVAQVATEATVSFSSVVSLETSEWVHLEGSECDSGCEWMLELGLEAAGKDDGGKR